MKTKQKKVVKDKYETIHFCVNCKNDIKFTIPKGIEVEQYLKNKKCKICGCSPDYKPLELLDEAPHY